MLFGFYELYVLLMYLLVHVARLRVKGLHILKAMSTVLELIHLHKTASKATSRNQDGQHYTSVENPHVSCLKYWRSVEGDLLLRHWLPILVLDWWENILYPCILWILPSLHHEYLMRDMWKGQSLKDIYLQYPWLGIPLLR